MIRAFLKKIIGGILLFEARLVIRKYRPKIVGVTGSVGKTSTKDAVALAFSPKWRVGKSPKTYNTEVGIPLAILGCKTGWDNPLLWTKNILEGLGLLLFPSDYPEWLVLEIGIDAPGDMRRITSWLPLDIAIITRVGETPVHVEFFSSPEELRTEKANIIEGLVPGGILIKNGDDRTMAEIHSRRGHRTYTYGFSPEADFRAEHRVVRYEKQDGVRLPAGMSYDVAGGEKSQRIELPRAFGANAVFATLAGFAAAVAAGVSPEKAAEALAKFQNPPGRLRVFEGVKDTLIIDDTYNASPVALSLALAEFAALKTEGRKIAVLGDMLELGRFTIGAHEHAGAEVASVADILLTVGARSKFLAAGARATGMKDDAQAHFKDSREAGCALQEIMRPGDIILVKGSQGMRMERVIEEVMRYPEKKAELLVRQDAYWQSRP